uniref:hypothetical protein n=1 Tax=Flavobacterium sp. TaxID=239 RepID=UPI00404AEF75
MKKTILFFLLLQCLFGNAQVKLFYKNNGLLRSSLDTLNGMYHGKFNLYNDKGIKLIDGNFKNNQKTGKWTFFDHDGISIVERNYKNSYQFETIYANETLPEPTFYPNARDKNDLIIYPIVPDSIITESLIQYRFIPKGNVNDLLFKDSLFFHIISKHISESTNIEIYKTSEFGENMNFKQIESKITKYDIDIIGFKIKEMVLFNKRTQSTEYRILGICPVVFINEYQFTNDLFWIFYPAIRAELASKKVSMIDDKNIRTVEDIFHFRRFNSYIYFLHFRNQTFYNGEEYLINLTKNKEKIREEAISLETETIAVDWIGLYNLYKN